jgi:hypothetical protein
MLDAGIVSSKENIDIGRLDSLLRVLFIHHSPVLANFFSFCFLGVACLHFLDRSLGSSNAKAFI